MPEDETVDTPAEEPTEPEGEEPSEPSSKVAPDLVNKAFEAYEKLKKQNEAMAKNLRKLEELQAIDVLSGRAEAGAVPKQKTQDEIDQEEADKVIKMFG